MVGQGLCCCLPLYSTNGGHVWWLVSIYMCAYLACFTFRQLLCACKRKSCDWSVVFTVQTKDCFIRQPKRICFVVRRVTCAIIFCWSLWHLFGVFSGPGLPLGQRHCSIYFLVVGPFQSPFVMPVLLRILQCFKTWSFQWVIHWALQLLLSFLFIILRHTYFHGVFVCSTALPTVSLHSWTNRPQYDPVPDMTYNVFCRTLNPAQSINRYSVPLESGAVLVLLSWVYHVLLLTIPGFPFCDCIIQHNLLPWFQLQFVAYKLLLVWLCGSPL